MTGPSSRSKQLITKKFKEMRNGMQCNECPRGALFKYAQTSASLVLPIITTKEFKVGLGNGSKCITKEDAKNL